MPLKFLCVFFLFFRILSVWGSLFHHFYVCRPPSICTDMSSCQDDFLIYGSKRTYCGFSGAVPKICCLSQNVATSTSSTNAPRVVRKNDDLLNHKNFAFLPFDKCGVVSNRLRIMSGASTSPGEFPWMALIAYKVGNSTSQQDFKCGGTLINKKYVLTAAHCIDNSTILGVRLGEYNVMTQKDCDPNGHCEPPVQDLMIDKVIIHPFYDTSTFINDIALVKLATPANFSYENVRPICLPFGELLDADLEGQKMIVAGWGATEEGNKSKTLRKVFVPVVPTPTCQKLYENIKPISKKQICAGADRGHDSCAGDSGGPLKDIDFINSTPRYVQYGIVSFGPTRCGLSKRPGIYTNLQKYMKWILDNLE